MKIVMMEDLILEHCINSANSNFKLTDRIEENNMKNTSK